MAVDMQSTLPWLVAAGAYMSDVVRIVERTKGVTNA